MTQGAAWLSFSPGGLGAVEASTAGLLVLLGISFDVATAISVMQRLADKGVNTVIGWVCYLFARRRYNLTGASLFRFEMPRAEEAMELSPGDAAPPAGNANRAGRTCVDGFVANEHFMACAMC